VWTPEKSQKISQYIKSIDTLIRAIDNQFKEWQSTHVGATPDLHLTYLKRLKEASKNLHDVVEECIILFR